MTFANTLEQESWKKPTPKGKMSSIKFMRAGEINHSNNKKTRNNKKQPWLFLVCFFKGGLQFQPGRPDNPDGLMSKCTSVLWRGEEVHPDPTYSGWEKGKKKGVTKHLNERVRIKTFCMTAGGKDGWNGCSRSRSAAEGSLHSQCGKCSQPSEQRGRRGGQQLARWGRQPEEPLAGYGTGERRLFQTFSCAVFTFIEREHIFKDKVDFQFLLHVKGSLFDIKSAKNNSKWITPLFLIDIKYNSESRKAGQSKQWWSPEHLNVCKRPDVTLLQTKVPPMSQGLHMKS